MRKKHPRIKGMKQPSPGLRGRIWIDGPEGTFLGYGRVALLERIREYGSITKAAQSLEMSYRRAWELVDSMNRQAPSAFVETATGGKGGGGARITKAGEEAIDYFQTYHNDFQEFLKKENSRLNKFTLHQKRRNTKK